MTIKSYQDQISLEFKAHLIDWTPHSIEIFLNFTNPSLVSTGANFDSINIKVLNGSNFKSEKGG